MPNATILGTPSTVNRTASVTLYESDWKNCDFFGREVAYGGDHFGEEDGCLPFTPKIILKISRSAKKKENFS